MPDSGTIPFKKADTNGHYRSLQLPNDAAEFMPALGLPAFAGDVVGPGGATVNQVAVFENATGKKIRAAVETGLAKLSGGVLSSVTAPVGVVVGDTDPQVLTNKTLINPTITGLTGLTKNDVGLGNVDNTSDANKPVSGPQQAALNLKQDLAAKAAANGYASLDAGAKVPLSQIPDSVVGGQQYQGTWNAATNVPALPSPAIGNKGWYYSVNVAGTTVPPGGGPSSWAVGDQVISNGSVWQKIANVSAVNSVNGYTGVVVLGKNDVGLGNVDNTSDAAKPVSTATTTQLALKEDKANKNVANGYAGLDATGKVPAANVPADLVTSVAAKQGVVTLVKADVGLGNVDNTSDATYSASSTTLTNKTINGANNTLTVRLANDVTGNLPVTNLNAGTGANSGSFWRGDGQWAPPAGGGDVVGPAGAVDGDIAIYNGATGKVIKTVAGKAGADLVAGPASSVDGELCLYSGTTGKIIRRFSGSAGFAKSGTTGLLTTQPKILAADVDKDVVVGSPRITVPEWNDLLLISETSDSGLLKSITYADAYPLPRNWLAEMVIANNVADAVNDVDITAGEARSDDNAGNIALPSAMTKRLDAAWAAGTGQGGRDTGVIADGYWYVFAIRNPSTNASDVLFSVSPTAPTMPSGFTQKRRIGNVKRETGSIRTFLAIGDFFMWVTPMTLMNSGAFVTGQVIGLAASAPMLGKLVRCNVTIQGYNNTAWGQYTIGPNGYGTPPMLAYSTTINLWGVWKGDVLAGADGYFMVGTPASAGGATYINVIMHGYYDDRGKGN